MEKLETHYEEVASSYESFWFYENDTPYQRFGVSNIIDICKVDRRMKLLDIGSGTCNFSRCLRKRAKLTSPMLCIEPSKDLLKEGIDDSKVKTNFSFVDRKKSKSVNTECSDNKNITINMEDLSDIEVVVDDSEVLGLCTDALNFVKYCNRKRNISNENKCYEYSDSISSLEDICQNRQGRGQDQGQEQDQHPVLNVDCIIMKEVIHHFETVEALNELFSEFYNFLTPRLQIIEQRFQVKKNNSDRSVSLMENQTDLQREGDQKDEHEYISISGKNILHHPVMTKSILIENKNRIENEISRQNPSGQILIITRPANSHHIPFFSKAHLTWAEAQLDSHIYIEALEAAGFDVRIEERNFTVEMTLTRWLDMLKARFWSNLANFTDVEIQEGIEEVRQMYLEKEKKKEKEKETSLSSDFCAFNNNLVSCDKNGKDALKENKNTLDSTRSVVFQDKLLYIVATWKQKLP